MTETMTIDFTRAALRALPRRARCHAGCAGWILSAGIRGLQIERCDECHAARVARLGGGAVICDEDVRALPEARAALRAEYRRLARERDVERRAMRAGAWSGLRGWAL